jgi:hypothetical protein
MRAPDGLRGCPCLLLLISTLFTAASLSAADQSHLLIVDGFLSGGGRSSSRDDDRAATFVGKYNSQLQAHIDAVFKPVAASDWRSHSWINSTVLRTLHVRSPSTILYPVCRPAAMHALR